MQYLRNLALVASMLCLALSPALAMNHGGSGEEGEHGNHNGPPPPPQSSSPGRAKFSRICFFFSAAHRCSA